MLRSTNNLGVIEATSCSRAHELCNQWGVYQALRVHESAQTAHNVSADDSVSRMISVYSFEYLCCTCSRYPLTPTKYCTIDLRECYSRRKMNIVSRFAQFRGWILSVADCPYHNFRRINLVHANSIYSLLVCDKSHSDECFIQS